MPPPMTLARGISFIVELQNSATPLYGITKATRSQLSRCILIPCRSRINSVMSWLRVMVKRALSTIQRSCWLSCFVPPVVLLHLKCECAAVGGTRTEYMVYYSRNVTSLARGKSKLSRIDSLSRYSEAPDFWATALSNNCGAKGYQCASQHDTRNGAVNCSMRRVCPRPARERTPRTLCVPDRRWRSRKHQPRRGASRKALPRGAWERESK